MKTFEQLAESAYHAYRKQAIAADSEGLAGHTEVWNELDAATKACWVAAVKQVSAEIAALH